MALTFKRTVHRIRSTRDLRGEVLADACTLTERSKARGKLILAQPLISQQAIEAEWKRIRPALAPAVRDRLSIVVEKSAKPTSRAAAGERVTLGRPNYLHEVLRGIVGAKLQTGWQTLGGLVQRIGASQTPVRAALERLTQAGIVRTHGRRLSLEVEEITLDRLAKVGALPQTLRFRFERGARPRTPADLLERAKALLGSRGPASWSNFALSGTPVAQVDVAALDLFGAPRVDLIAHVGRRERSFDVDLLRSLDDGLELEPNVLAPAAVVVTLVRADDNLFRQERLRKTRSAYPFDVFLALLDAGLDAQALQYAQAIRG